jgi:GNAT superfamily N-acetyltransferase
MNDGLSFEKLRSDHPVADFTCSQAELDRFLIRFAFANQQAGSATTYVAMFDREVIGFYTLTVGQVAHAEAAPRLVKGLPRYPIPIVLLARLAVKTSWQDRGVGAALLQDAMRRTLEAAGIAGIRALVVHAKDDNACRFYEHFDFAPSPSDPLHLYLLIKDIRAELD